MNRISIVKIFELSGIATIILSLVFIVYEIRQANTIAMIEAGANRIGASASRAILAEAQ